jgi:hypothetical protein
MTRTGRVHQLLQDLLFRQAGSPAVGAGHSGIQLVVQFFEDADQALLVDLALLFVQILPAALLLWTLQAPVMRC